MVHIRYLAWVDSMSLYSLQKLLYQLNRDEELQAAFQTDREAVIAKYTLTDEELKAVREEDVGMLYILGVNGQILMHFAAMCGLAWPDYVQTMRDALEIHGNVRAGIYATTDGKGAV